MRIGTWNLEGRWTARHERVVGSLGCDLWIFTEAPGTLALPAHHAELSRSRMREGTHWVGLLSRSGMQRESDPHPASVIVEVSGLRVIGSVLPWPLAADAPPWEGTTPLARMSHATAAIIGGGAKIDVWAGDLNQPLSGGLQGFGRATQEHLLKTLSDCELQVPTAQLPGRHAPQRTIDHIAVAERLKVERAGMVSVRDELSDHDVYWVDVDIT